MRRSGGLITFGAGQTIITEGEPGAEMFIVEDGQIEILRGKGEDEKQVGVLEHGDFFGEMSVIDDLPRGATAKAVTDCRLLAIDHSTFDQMLRQYPEVAIRMLRKMTARLRELEAAVETLGAKGAVQAAVSPATVTPPIVAPSVVEEPDNPRTHVTNVKLSRPEVAAPAISTTTPTPVVVARETAAEPPAVSPPKRTGRLYLMLFETGAHCPLADTGDIRVGRFDSVTGMRPDIDLSEADVYKTTSRRHAKFVREGGHVYLCEEIATANGTYVNGERLGSGARVEVKDGDWIQFGAVKTILKAG